MLLRRERRGAACLMFLMFQKRFLQDFWEVKKQKQLMMFPLKLKKEASLAWLVEADQVKQRFLA